MARIKLTDVLNGKNPNTQKMQEQAAARIKKQLTEKMAAEGKRRRSELTKVQDTESMLKSGKRMETSATKQTPTGAGTYPSYKKESSMASNFRDEFAKARKTGKKEFTWNGRKYNTKVK